MSKQSHDIGHQKRSGHNNAQAKAAAAKRRARKAARAKAIYARQTEVDNALRGIESDAIRARNEAAWAE